MPERAAVYTVATLVSGVDAMSVAHAAGYVALVLFSNAVVLGLMTSARARLGRWPLFVTRDVHRNLSLLALVFLGVHIATVITPTPFLHLGTPMPFSSETQPFWVGLGVIAAYLGVAIAMTAALSHRIPDNRWRIAHWLTYPMWMMAMLHAVGAGADTRTAWGIATTAVCALAVCTAVIWRLGVAMSLTATARGALRVAVVVGVVTSVWWTLIGPLQNWWGSS